MADPTHLLVSALDGVVKPGRIGRATTIPGVTVRELRGAGLATVTARNGRRAALLDAAGSAFGAELPAMPRRIEGRDIAFVWSGPDHGRTLLRVTGPHVRDALTKGVPIDLHPRAFKPGDAAATLVAHIPVHLWQIDERPTYEFAVARSMAQSFWHWLAASSAQYGLEFVDR